ncbi:ABC transporter ATP-binding protein [Halorubrum tibetense]|uniref:ABC-type D-xylose/L-arabinose transporter n=1 Tax=Halorubrum tibetense TaxID=175631 RepID=A0ABD5S7M6_9EURY
MASVTLNGITKRYGDEIAVDDMNLEINDGEFVTFVGPSGCGKSTTMQTIAGLTIPTEGSVEIGGRDVTNLPPKDRGISMVFQNIALFPHMDVYDNISFGLRLRKYDQEEVDRRVEEAADVVQLGGMMDRMPEEMSGGQRQRVAIARAIVREPEVFLMDEPLANLDAELKVHMRTQLQRLHRKLDTTIIYVTHDQAQAMTMSDRIAVIDSGELQQVDPPLKCYNEPDNLFVAGFIGSPAMNFIEGQVTTDGFESRYTDLSFDPDIQGVDVGQDVTVGVRPENIHLAAERDKAEEPTRPLEAIVDVIEPMGDKVFAYLLSDESVEASAEGRGEGQLLINLPPDTTIQEGDDVEIVLDRTNVHLFDTASGDAIRHELA